jgi:hypothetical protein
VYYISNQDYDGFCASSVVTNSFAEMPKWEALLMAVSRGMTMILGLPTPKCFPIMIMLIALTAGALRGGLIGQAWVL